MSGIVAEPTALKFLFDDARMSLYRHFIAQRQSQIGQSAVGILPIGTVKAEDAFPHDKPGSLLRRWAAVFLVMKISKVRDADMFFYSRFLLHLRLRHLRHPCSGRAC